jgi:hypothetical protein
MLGAPLPKPPKGKTWWGDSELVGAKWVHEDGLFEVYKPGRGAEPKTDENSKIVGFFVAVGASGKRGIPYLEGPIDLALAKSDQRYHDAYMRACAAWEKFAAFCQEHEVTLEAPRLWLVETEVA